ncbi:MAG: prolyl oligopeptidase family serine peptidase, partial [Halobacteriaceae archaeon]
MDRVEATDYYDLAAVSDPRVSPDGERVAFVRSAPRDEEDRGSTVHVVPVGGGEPRQFTVSEGHDGQPRWSPSGDRLAFVSERGEETEGGQLWVMPTGGGEARRVTDVPGGVDDVAWRPDGSALSFTQSALAGEREEGVDLERPADFEREEPDPRVVDRLVYRAHENYFDGARTHVYLARLDDDEVERLTEGDADFTEPTWGDADTLFWAVERGPNPDDSDEWTVEAHDVPSGETAARFETEGWQPLLAATADGRVAHTHTPAERMTLRQTEVRVHDPETGDVRTLTDRLDRTVGSGPQWGDDGERVYFTTPDEGSVVLRRVADDADADPEVTLGGEREVEGFDVGRDAVAFVQSEWDHPGDVFAATPGGAEEVRLTRVNADYLEGRAVREPEAVTVEVGDHEVEGWVLTPPDFDPGEEYPLVVEIHGGPHATWTTSGTMWHEFQTLAARGYVVSWCNPRGSSGYGESFAAAIERDWGRVTSEDVLAFADAVAAREYVDDGDQFVTGGSFGGFATGWLVGHTDRFDGAVAQRGVYDIASFYGSTDAFKLVEGDFGTTPWEEPELCWEQSPVAHVEDVSTPTLVMHAENDYRVPVNNGE